MSTVIQLQARVVIDSITLDSYERILLEVIISSLAVLASTLLAEQFENDDDGLMRHNDLFTFCNSWLHWLHTSFGVIT